jgi:TRAP-type C4-dicarboxylate transport system permease large subunit
MEEFMLKVIVPIALMIIIVLVKKIPYIGGDVRAGLLVTGLSALLMGGIYSPVEWITAWIGGIDRIAWVIGLSVFGSIYAESQTRIGALETVLTSMRATFGKSPRGLVVAVIISLGIAGSLLGDSIAAATVVGVLSVKSLYDLGLKGEYITAIIVIGASLGSIMPPISQALFLAASLAGADPDAVVQISYITVGLSMIITTTYAAFFFVKKDTKLPAHLIPEETAITIVRSRWKTLIPLMFLVFLVLLRSVPFIKLDVLTILLNKIVVGGQPLLVYLKGITIVKGVTNGITLILIAATILAAIVFPEVRNNKKSVLIGGLKNVKNSATVQICTGLMLGAFKVGGQIEAVQQYAQGLTETALKWGGAGSMTLLGMLTGTQSTPQSTMLPFLAPALESLGIDPVNIAVASAHVSAAGQGLPPADLLTFMVVGLVSGMLGMKIDPIKSMIYSAPFCICLFAAGMIFLYI